MAPAGFIPAGDFPGGDRSCASGKLRIASGSQQSVTIREVLSRRSGNESGMEYRVPCLFYIKNTIDATKRPKTSGNVTVLGFEMIP
jgi:hypothetical protein